MTSGATDIRNWIRNIEQHASDNVNKILVGNKADMDESKRVSIFILRLCIFSSAAFAAAYDKVFLAIYVSVLRIVKLFRLLS
jgi:GTPase SAR1 family protein